MDSARNHNVEPQTGFTLPLSTNAALSIGLQWMKQAAGPSPGVPDPFSPHSLLLLGVGVMPQKAVGVCNAD